MGLVLDFGCGDAVTRPDRTPAQHLRVNLMNRAVDLCLMCFKQVPIIPGTQEHERGGGRCLAMETIETMIDESLA